MFELINQAHRYFKRFFIENDTQNGYDRLQKRYCTGFWSILRGQRWRDKLDYQPMFPPKFSLFIDPEVVGELKEALIKGKAGFISSSLNLLKCIIGAGILSLPWTVSVLGMLTFTGILLPAAACGLFSIYLLLHCCDKFHVFTYERVTENAFKKRFDRPILGRKIAAFFVSTTALGSICSYSFIIKSQLPELIKFLLVQLNVACFDNTIWFLNGNNILILIMAFIIFPLTCFKKLDFLKYSSGSGFFVMVFCILVIVTFKFLNVGCESVLSNGLSNSTTTQSNLCNYVPSKKSLKDWASFKSSLDQLRNDSTNGLTQGTECQAVYFKPMSQTLTDDFGKAVSSIFFAFNCHDTLLSIYDNLKHGSKPKMMKVASSVMSVVVILYMVTAFFGYLTWYWVFRQGYLTRLFCHQQTLLLLFWPKPSFFL